MQRIRIALATLAVALAPAAAQAQLAPQPNAQEYLNYLNASTAVASTGLSPSVYVGPYQGRFETGGVISSNFALYCVDYLHYASNSDGLVNVYGVGGGFGDVSTTRFGDAGVYRSAAYLASMFEDYEGASNQRQMWSSLHSAIWRTTSGNNTATNALVEDYADSFFAMGQNVPQNFDASEWYVLSSVELADAGYANANYDGTGQEFLVRVQQTRGVPEPGSMLLLATGLLMLAFVSRRREIEGV